jgi:hypothetical protein
MRLPGGKSSAHWPPTRFLMTHTPQSCTIFRLVCGSHRIKKLLARTMRAARYLSTQAHGVGVSSKTFILPAEGKVDFCTLRFAKSTAFEYVMRGASLVCVVCVVYERAGEPESNYGAINRFTRVYRDASGSNNYRSAHVCSQTLVGCARAPRADTTSTACTHSSTLTGWGKATN